MNGQKPNHGIDEHLKYIHESIDPKDNGLTSPPNDEIVRIPCIWVFEAFPPSFIANLVSSAEKMGWTRDDLLMNRNFIENLENIRSRFSGMGWANLGYIQRESKTPFERSCSAELPDGVQYIHASLVHFMSSTSILALQFFLDDSLANSIQLPLSEEYSTYKEKIERGWRIHDVGKQKKQAVDAMRMSIRSVCTEWMRNYFPGLFASGMLGDNFPTCEVITFRTGQPYAKVGEKDYKSYLAMLNLHQDTNGWMCHDIQGLFLQLPGSGDQETDRLVMSGNINEMLTDNQLEGFWTVSRESKIISWMEELDQTLGIWALYRTTRNFEKRLAEFRDQYSSVNIENMKQAATRINELDKEFLVLQRSLMPFTQELQSFCNDENIFMHKVYKFQPACERRKSGSELFNSIRLTLLTLSEQLQKYAEVTHTIAQRTAQIIYTLSNFKLARTNIGLQVCIAVMTGILLILALLPFRSEIFGHKTNTNIEQQFIIKSPCSEK